MPGILAEPITNRSHAVIKSHAFIKTVRSRGTSENQAVQGTMKALVLRKHGGLDELEVVARLPDAQGRRRPRGHPRARGLVQLPRRVHGARHAGHQGAAAGDHRPRYGGRDRRGGRRRQRLEGRRQSAGQSGQQEERPDGRDARRRHGGILRRRSRPARRHAGGRQLRGGGVIAGRLRHGASHADHPRHRQSRRARAGARRLGRRRHRLRAAGQDARRRSHRLRVERGEA